MKGSFCNLPAETSRSGSSKFKGMKKEGVKVLVVLLDCVWVVGCVGIGRRGDALEGVEGGVLGG